MISDDKQGRKSKTRNILNKSKDEVGEIICFHGLQIFIDIEGI